MRDKIGVTLKEENEKNNKGWFGMNQTLKNQIKIKLLKEGFKKMTKLTQNNSPNSWPRLSEHDYPIEGKLKKITTQESQ